jgi:hypothetical protein
MLIFIIPGNGPAALLAAWQAAVLGNKIQIISKHGPDYLRMNRVFLTFESRLFLLNLLSATDFAQADENDLRFIKDLLHSYTLGLKDIERFIKRRLDTDFSSQITYVYHSTITAVDMNGKEVKIQSTMDEAASMSLPFDYLIGADGTHHSLANIFNACYPEQAISYIDCAQEKITLTFLLTSLLKLKMALRWLF